MFPIFVGTVLAEHLVGKLCNSLRAHGRKIQKSHYSSKMRGMYGVGTSSDVTFSLMLFNSFAKVCPARGPQRSRPSHSPHHAKLTHIPPLRSKGSPRHTIHGFIQTTVFKLHQLSSRWTAPERESAFSPLLSSIFTLKGLPQHTPFAVVPASRGSPLLSSLIALAARIPASITQALIRPPGHQARPCT